MILGGDSKSHKFTEAAAERLDEQLRALAGLGWRLRITASRRTPDGIRARFRQLADEIGARFWSGTDDGPNPYIAWLTFSDVAIVTEDSANMLSDATWHGLPLHIARLEGQSEKFDKLHKSLISMVRRVGSMARWKPGPMPRSVKQTGSQMLSWTGFWNAPPNQT